MRGNHGQCKAGFKIALRPKRRRSIIAKMCSREGVKAWKGGGADARRRESQEAVTRMEELWGSHIDARGLKALTCKGLGGCVCEKEDLRGRKFAETQRRERKYGREKS